MKYWLLLVIFLLTGCTSMLIGNALQQGKDLSSEQLKAYNEIGSAVYQCLNVSGPPPMGSTTIIIVPKGSQMSFKFGDGCHLLNQ